MRLNRIPVTLALIIILVLMLASSGFCAAKARATWWGKNSAYALAACGPMTNVGPPPPYPNPVVTFGTPAIQTHWAYCGTSGAAAYALASGLPLTPPRAFVWAKAWAAWGWGRAGKAPAANSDFVSIDTTGVWIESVDTLHDSVLVNMSGKIQALPGNGSYLRVDVFQNNDTTDIIFTGTLFINGNTKQLTVTGFAPGSFGLNIIGDTSRLQFGPMAICHLPYTGAVDSLGVSIHGDPQALKGRFVPSLTYYGLIILILLIAASAIWIYLQKKKGAVRTA